MVSSEWWHFGKVALLLATIVTTMGGIPVHVVEYTAAAPAVSLTLLCSSSLLALGQKVAIDFLSGRLSVDGRIYAQMQRRVGRVSSLWTRIELVPAPVVEHTASTPAVFAAPAPVVEHISSSCSNRGTCAGDGIRRTMSCSDRSTCVSGGVHRTCPCLDRSTCASDGVHRTISCR